MQNADTLYYKKYSPTHGLEKYVKYLWVMEGYEKQSAPDLLIPDGYPEIIFVQDGAYRKDFVASHIPHTIINRSCVIGVQTQSVLARRLNGCHLIGVKLRPPAAYALFGAYLTDLADTNWALEELDETWLCELDQCLKCMEEEQKIIDILSATLLRQISNRGICAEYQTATSFLQVILRSKGQISVSELACYHCLSVRHFQRKFKTFFGVSPKKFLSIIRFKQLYKASILQKKYPKDFLAYGYYDQMHFIKDFQKHLGVNPSQSSETSFRERNEMAQRNA